MYLSDSLLRSTRIVTWRKCYIWEVKSGWDFCCLWMLSKNLHWIFRSTKMWNRNTYDNFCSFENSVQKFLKRGYFSCLLSSIFLSLSLCSSLFIGVGTNSNCINNVQCYRMNGLSYLIQELIYLLLRLSVPTIWPLLF